MRGCRRRGVGAATLALILWWAATGTAQVGGGGLTGAVSDGSVAPVPGATVTATAAATNLSRSAETGPDGGFAFVGLTPGTYQVTVERRGFRPLRREGVRVATGETVRLDLQLVVGSVSDSFSTQ